MPDLTRLAACSGEIVSPGMCGSFAGGYSRSEEFITKTAEKALCSRYQEVSARGNVFWIANNTDRTEQDFNEHSFATLYSGNDIEIHSLRSAEPGSVFSIANQCLAQEGAHAIQFGQYPVKIFGGPNRTPKRTCTRIQMASGAMH